MNKRSLIFFCLLSASMLITNLFFKPKAKEPKAQAAVEQQVTRPSLETRIATQAELPLVEIYKDEEGKKLLTSALLFNDQMMTLAWDEELPESVYYKKSYSAFPLEKASLKGGSAEVGDPIVLSTSSEKIGGADLPKSGSYHLQLIEPKAFKASQEITPATYSDGKIFLAEGSKVKGNALALAKGSSGNYEPVGIYIQGENKLVSLKNFSELSNFVNLHKFTLPSRISDEKFYVLENENQQLVFSNYGGALAEINLPFKDQDHQTSKVYSVDFDDQLKEQDSPHSLFPAHDYYVAGSSGKKSPTKGGYYPMIRRTVDEAKDSARYYAFNLVSNYPEISELTYKVTHFSKDKIVFESNQSHRKIVKTYTLDKTSPYGLNLAIKTEGDNTDLWLSTGVPEVELISNMQSPVIKYRHQKKKKFEVNKQKLPKETYQNMTISPDWVSNSNSFFTLLVDPQESGAPGYKVNKVKDAQLPSRLSSLELSKKAKNVDGYEFLLPLKASSDEVKFKIFAGPLEKSLLAQAGQEAGKNTNYLGAQTYNGFLNFISEPCAKFLFIFLNMFHKITSSWGLSIILLTILLRVILFPLNSWSIKAMRRNQEIAPEINAIQQKYKKSNPKQAQIEIMQLYRKRKVNPFTGCLPMLIQMPFLIGMFSLLRSAFVLRGVPFIKGWISSLTAPDVLFTWSKAIPFFGTEFHLLPLISCVMIWLQQKIASPLPVDKSQMTDQQKQQKMMSYFMLLFVTLLCYNLPSGLNLYFISSTLLGILQQWITNRLMDKKKSKPTIIDKKKASLKGTEA